MKKDGLSTMEVKPALALPDGLELVAYEKMENVLTMTVVSTQESRITSREIVPAGRISPLFLRASEVPTIVPCCFRMLFWQQERLALRRWTGTISREAGFFGAGGPLA